jgi:hypothetical protein
MPWASNAKLSDHSLAKILAAGGRSLKIKFGFSTKTPSWGYAGVSLSLAETEKFKINITPI